MNPDTGHLVSDTRLLDDVTRQKYVPVPMHLRDHAERELAGRPDAYVSQFAQTALADWMRKTKAKNRTRAKIAKRSRKANR